jgi:ATP-dependent Clp protease protease subunit
MLGLPVEPSRSIVLSTDIDQVIAQQVIAQIMDINQIDSERIDALKGYQPEPIELFINSGGGSVTDGFAIIGAMEASDTPIITYGMGLVASMALAIFVAGDYRVSARHTRYMYHSISYGMIGHITEHEDMGRECDLMQRMYNSLMFERTSFTEDKLKEIRAMKKDYFFSAKEAVKLGVVDEVLKKPEKKIMTEAEFNKMQEEQDQ